ncbi:MAG: hypothetical protein CVT88_01110 [Candidatus Altiarchaeales archaeon HGW-Altiarchaeales-1]|nr:MAG: hypothetical protein CVT88_01110 [Candidatus Altiarchaeales archaeon HGW-Altiarchaeales-1]
MQYRLNHRDFIEKDSKFYAVLSTSPLLCSLRYVLKERTPEKVDGGLAIIDDTCDIKIFSGRERLKEIIKHPKDRYEQDVCDLAKFLSNFTVPENLGISGSGLIKCYRDDSDIDFVVYGTKNFNNARDAIKQEILNLGAVKDLNLEQWKELHTKRIFGNELTFDEFLWHEKRKFNKGTINNRKFDLLLSDDTNINLNFKKIGNITKRGKVVKASPFSYPAHYEIVEGRNQEIIKILCFTHTYVGQAFEGENIEVCGMLEEINNGTGCEKFIIVGTSRKAIGEYIKVLK